MHELDAFFEDYAVLEHENHYLRQAVSALARCVIRQVDDLKYATDSLATGGLPNEVASDGCCEHSCSTEASAPRNFSVECILA